MKYVQVIDGADNCVYDIFALTDEEYALIFPPGTDVAFIDEVYARGVPAVLDASFAKIWERRVKKIEAEGIHGTLFCDLERKKVYYPDRTDEGARNPDGTRLR